MLKNFLSQFYFEDYVPQPKHVIYPSLMMAAGYKSLTVYNWETFGGWMFFFGCLLMLVIIFGIAWRGPIEYWKQIEHVVHEMLKIKSPEVWQALGFKEIPAAIQITERKTDEQGNFMGFEYKQVPIPPRIMQAVANKVLLSNSTDFTETEYGNIIPNWRKVQSDFKKKNYIKKTGTKHVLTHKGMLVIYEYADRAIIKQIEGERKNASNT